MPFDSMDAQLGMRNRMLTLATPTTGAVNLTASTAGYVRSVGSFLDDGFFPGMELTAVGFGVPGNNGIKMVKSVVPLQITTVEGNAVEGISAASLVVGLPALRTFDNESLSRVAGRPYIEEDFICQPSSIISLAYQGGEAEITGLYVIRWFGVEKKGAGAVRRGCDGLLELFKSGTVITTAKGQIIRVRGRPTGPWAGDIKPADAGWVVCTVTIPWRARFTN